MPNSFLHRRLAAFRDATRGLSDLIRNHPPAKIHILAALGIIIMGLVTGFSQAEWLAVIVCIGLVFTAEACNTAIEYLTDLVSPDYHVLAGKTKDMAAAAVLCASIIAFVVGLVILLPKFW